MPTYSRTALRNRASFDFLHDLDVYTNTGSLGATAGSVYVMATALVDPAASGFGLYEGAWLYINGQEYMVASYNVASGALVSPQPALADLPAGSLFEVNKALSPRDKQFALNDTIKRIRVRQEIAVEGVTGRVRYSLDGTASPNGLEAVLDVYWLEDPSVATTQRRQRLTNWEAVRTGSGHELRIDPPVPSGAALIVDATVEVSLGAGDLATVNLPDDRWVAVGAAAQCLWQMERRSGPEGVVYRLARAELEAEFARLTKQYGAWGYGEGKNPDGLDPAPVPPNSMTHEPF